MENNHEVYEIFERNQIKLFISKEHRFGTDSLLLGEFAGQAKVENKVIVDLCSGCGVIPAMLTPFPEKAYAVELQQNAADLIRRTVEENKLDFLNVIQGDLRRSETFSRIGRESVDLVTANPPYFPENSGFERESVSQKTARHEKECSLYDVVKAAAYLLKFGGELKMCMTASRLAETIGIMQGFSIEPKEIELISSPKNNKARLFLISGKKGAKPGVKITWK